MTNYLRMGVVWSESRVPFKLLGPNHIFGTAKARVVKFCVHVLAITSVSLKMKRLRYSQMGVVRVT